MHLPVEVRPDLTPRGICRMSILEALSQVVTHIELIGLLQVRPIFCLFVFVHLHHPSNRGRARGGAEECGAMAMASWYDIDGTGLSIVFLHNLLLLLH
jgi:hypothetical protein